MEAGGAGWLAGNLQAREAAATPAGTSLTYCLCYPSLSHPQLWRLSDFKITVRVPTLKHILHIKTK